MHRVAAGGSATGDELLDASEALIAGVLAQDNVHPGVDDLVDAGQAHADQVQILPVSLPRDLVHQDVHLHNTQISTQISSCV